MVEKGWVENRLLLVKTRSGNTPSPNGESLRTHRNTTMRRQNANKLPAESSPPLARTEFCREKNKRAAAAAYTHDPREVYPYVASIASGLKPSCDPQHEKAIPCTEFVEYLGSHLLGNSPHAIRVGMVRP